MRLRSPIWNDQDGAPAPGRPSGDVLELRRRCRQVIYIKITSYKENSVGKALLFLFRAGGQ